MTRIANQLQHISGRFWRAVRPGCEAGVLDPPGPESAGRYHRPGEAVLYMSAAADWARVAVGKYAAAEGAARVVVPLEVTGARVLDQRDPAVCHALGIVPFHGDWREPFARGEEVPTWRIADLARELGADGLIDPSRKVPGGWHLNLFRWNEPGSPVVQVAGTPLPAGTDPK